MSRRLPECDVRGVNPENIVCKPLTSRGWNDFERLLGLRGAWGGCWCMYWRLGDAPV
jgi:hypothetical protein